MVEEVTMARSNRRNFLKHAPVIAATAVAAAAPTAARAAPQPHERLGKVVHWSEGNRPAETPMFSGVVSYGNLVFVSGIGAVSGRYHGPRDITAHTDYVLTEIQKRLEDAGSSMEKVLKVSVYLNDLADFQAMNKVFLGRFGPEPGARSTIAAVGGIPGNSLVEIDCIAYV